MVLVEMRTTVQAAKVAEATGGVHMLGKNDKDGKAPLGHPRGYLDSFLGASGENRVGVGIVQVVRN